MQSLPRRDRQFLQLLSTINQLPVSSAGEIRILRNAEEFYPAIETRIREAKHHIHLEFYIWQDDPTGGHMLQLLTDAARRGVIVRLMLDGVGSHGFPENRLTEYRKADGHFPWFQSLDPKRLRFFMKLRNHRKLQNIDGTIAFVGSMNIGDEHVGLDAALGHWRDVQVEVVGSVATNEKIFDPAYFPATTAPTQHPVHIVLREPEAAPRAVA